MPIHTEEQTFYFRDSSDASSAVEQRWSTASVKILLRMPSRLLLDPAWLPWFQQRGGLTRIYAYLRSLPLADEKQTLLNLLLDQPEAPPRVYIEALHVSRSAYFYRLNSLLSTLVEYLNIWECTVPPAQPAPLDFLSNHPGNPHAALPAMGFSEPRPSGDQQLPVGPGERLYWESIGLSEQPIGRPISHLPQFTPATQLLERGDALKQVRQFLGSCALRPRAVLRIDGPVGVGRSFFLEQVVGMSMQCNVAVLHIRAAGPSAPAFGSLVDALQSQVPCGAAPADVAGWVAWFQQWPVMQQASLRILCVDDLPLLDLATLAVLRQLLHTFNSLPINLVYTAGQDDLDVLGLPVQERLTLHPLSEQATAGWATALLGDPVPPMMVAWLYREAEGLPALLQQALAALIEHGIVRWNEGRWQYAATPIKLSLRKRAPAARLAPHNLPASITSFVGRADLFSPLAHLLENNRLVTITGAGGIGKTRLALELGRLLRRRFPDGVYVVALQTVTDLSGLFPAILRELNIKDDGQWSAADQLSRFLADLRMLLILDDAEHLLAGGKQIGQLLDRATNLRLLVTSRERLHVQGEVVFPLEGLSRPDVSEHEHIDMMDAVSLFVQRAQTTDPSFAITADNQPAVLEICRLTDGMPLAIEMAAAWVRIIPCEAIATGIADGLDVLTTQLIDLPERHRSIRAVFDHSWRLLSAEERSGFRSLAIFPTAFTRSAAEQIAGIRLPTLAALLDKSLIRRSAEKYYEIHGLLRRYAEAQLAAYPLEHAQLQHRYTNYYREIAARYWSEVEGPQQPAWLHWIDKELPNLQAALIWAHQQEDVATLCELCRFLVLYWYQYGYYREGRKWYEMILSFEQLTPLERADIYGCAALFLTKLGEWTRAFQYREQALAIYRTAQDPALLIIALHGLGYQLCVEGRFAEAQPLLEESLQMYERYRPRVASPPLSHIHLSYIALETGNFKTAEQHLNQARVLAEEWGEQRLIIDVLVHQGLLSLIGGDYLVAQQAILEGLQLCHMMGGHDKFPTMLDMLAAIESAAGQHATAAQLMGAAQARRECTAQPVPVLFAAARYEQLIGTVRSNLPPDVFAKAWAEGRRLRVADIIPFVSADAELK